MQSRRAVLLACVLAAAVPACGRGGDAAPSERSARTVRRFPVVVADSVPAGTTFALTLYQALSPANRVGDAFIAVLPEALRGSGGGEVVPAGAVVRGRLTQVAPAGILGVRALIRITFESVSFAGRSLPLSATIVAAEPQRRAGGAGTRADSSSVDSAGASPAGVIAADNPAQARTGAAGGTAIAMGSAGDDVVLPAGSKLTVRLDAPLLTGGAQ